MEPVLYTKVFGMGLGIWLLCALPLTAATIISLASGKALKNKIIFVVSSGVVSYGIGALTFVVFIPFTMLAAYFAPQWYTQGYEVPANLVTYMSEAGDIILFIAVIACSFLVPIIGRKKYWSSLCECMANK